MPEPETEPPMIFKTPAPFNPPGIYTNNNNIPATRLPPKNKHGRINTEAEERTAMIIGIVAGALIAVILVILLVLWIKSNGDRSYKMEHDLKYGHGANAALLGHNAGHSNNQQQQQQHQAGASAHHGGSHHNGNNGQQQQNQQFGNGYNNGGGQNYDAHGNGGHQGSSMGPNGSLRQHGSQHSDRNGMSAGPVQPKAKRNSKDIKEWYV
jgi:leucine-rich repeat transmembrane neuronal protein 1/2